jgi:hypothetical protein
LDEERDSNTYEEPLCLLFDERKSFYTKLEIVKKGKGSKRELTELTLDLLDEMNYIWWDLKRVQRTFIGQKRVTKRLRDPWKRRIYMHAAIGLIDTDEALELLKIYDRHRRSEFFNYERYRDKGYRDRRSIELEKELWLATNVTSTPTTEKEIK